MREKEEKELAVANENVVCVDVIDGVNIRIHTVHRLSVFVLLLNDVRIRIEAGIVEIELLIERTVRGQRLQGQRGRMGIQSIRVVVHKVHNVLIDVL